MSKSGFCKGLPEGKLDKNDNPLKFCRDLESNWTVKRDKPHYGLKVHASVDVRNGFILASTLTAASENVSKYLPYLTIASCHTKEPIEKVYADKGYYGQPNRSFLHLNGIKDSIMRKGLINAKLTDIEIQRNKKTIKVKIHCRTILWDEPPARWGLPGEVHYDS